MLRPVLVVLAVCFLCTVTRDRQVLHRADIRTVEAVQPAAVAGVQASPAHTPANATAGDIPSSNTSRRLHASPPTGRRSSQVECAAGAAGPDCRPCPSDHYSPGGSNATCQQCPPGSSSWGGARACVSGLPQCARAPRISFALLRPTQTCTQACSQLQHGSSSCPYRPVPAGPGLDLCVVAAELAQGTSYGRRAAMAGSTTSSQPAACTPAASPLVPTGSGPVTARTSSSPSSQYSPLPAAAASANKPLYNSSTPTTTSSSSLLQLGNPMRQQQQQQQAVCVCTTCEDSGSGLCAAMTWGDTPTSSSSSSSGSGSSGSARSCLIRPPKAFPNLSTAWGVIGHWCRDSLTGRVGHMVNGTCYSAASSQPAASAAAKSSTSSSFSLWCPFRVTSCTNRCRVRGLVSAATGRRCYCDYWCSLYNDCCSDPVSKDTACPGEAPTLDMSVIDACSTRTNSSRGACAGYRPAGCYCDGLCQAAGDCCRDCTGACGAAGCKPDPVQALVLPSGPPVRPGTAQAGMEQVEPSLDARTSTTSGSRSSSAPTGSSSSSRSNSSSSSSFNETAAFEVGRGYFEAVQACLDATSGGPYTPLLEVPVVWTTAQLKGKGGNYPRTKITDVLAALNAAYARASIRFVLADVRKWNFSDISTATASDCFDGDPNCARCQAYRAAGPGLANLRALHIFSLSAVASAVEDLGIAGAVSLYASKLVTTPPQLRCMDGLVVMEDDGGIGMPLMKATLIHEVAHWLDQGHTWNQVGWPRMQRDQVCAAAADLANYTTFGLAHDGVRDTPPQAAARFRQAVYLPCDGKTGLVPDPSTWRNDSQTCVNATGFPRGDRFYSNFYNIMSYFTSECDRAQGRRKTFTPDQNARMRCAYQCYRLGQCQDGTFMY